MQVRMGRESRKLRDLVANRGKDMIQDGSLGFGKDGGINIRFQASILHRPGYWSGLIDNIRIYNRAIIA